MNQFITDPKRIEQESMRLISEQLGDKVFPPDEDKIIKRIIHTTADFDYADITVISKDAIRNAKDALLSHKCIINTDTQMIVAGVNKRVLKELNGSIECYVGHEDVVKMAKQEGITRSMANMRYAARRNKGGIYVIGNAPTALYEVVRLIRDGDIRPALVIGVPVGFVEAAESKDELMEVNVPFITTRGRKGGSTVAVAIINALLYMIHCSRK